MLDFKRHLLVLCVCLIATILAACGNTPSTPPSVATVISVDSNSIFDGNDQLTTSLTDTLAAGEKVTAVLDDPSAAHNWLFQGTAGQTVTITVQSPVDAADPAVTLIDPQGNIMVQVDDNFGPDDEDVQIVLDLPQDGLYTIRVTTLSGGEYEIDVQ